MATKAPSRDLDRKKAYMRQYQARRLRLTRAKVLHQYDMKCAECGYSGDHRALQVDHVDGSGAEERKRMGKSPFKIMERALAEPENFQLLCANCNILKAYRNDEVESNQEISETIEYFLDLLAEGEEL